MLVCYALVDNKVLHSKVVLLMRSCAMRGAMATTAKIGPNPKKVWEVTRVVWQESLANLVWVLPSLADCRV